MNEKLDKLNKMLKIIDNDKLEKGKKEAKVEMSLAGLKNDFSINNEAEAKDYLKKKRSQQLKINKDIIEDYNDLIENFGEV